MTTLRAPFRYILVGVLVAGATLAVYYRFWVCRSWDQAQQALNDNELPLARTHLEHCLTQWPNDAEVHFLMARTCRRIGDIAAARSHLRPIDHNKQFTDRVELEELLILVQTQVVNAEEAARERLAEVPPETPLIVEAMVKGYLAGGFLEKAHAMASHWVEAAPGEWYPLYVRGTAVAAARDGDQVRMGQAINDIKTVLKTKPDHLEAQHALAQLYEGTGQESLASPWYQAYLRVRPDHPAAAAALARCQRALGENAAARRALDAWLVNHSTTQNLEVFQIRGQLALDTGALSEAKDWFIRSYRLARKNPDTLRLLVQVCRLRKETTEAEKYRLEESSCSNDLDQVKKIMQTITRMGQNGSFHKSDAVKIADLYFNLGSVLLRLDKTAAGINSLHIALRFQPDHAGARRLLDDWKHRPP